MFSRKPQTGASAKKNMQRNHSNQTPQAAIRFIPSAQTSNGFVNVNGTLLPF